MLEEKTSQNEKLEPFRAKQGLQGAAPGGLCIRLTHDLIGAPSHRLKLSAATEANLA